MVKKHIPPLSQHTKASSTHETLHSLRGRNVANDTTLPRTTQPTHSYAPVQGKVTTLIGHLFQVVDHLCVEDDGVHVLGQVLVVPKNQTGLADTAVGLQAEPVQPEAVEVK